MRYESFDITAPSLLGCDYNEAEVLGSAVWLWMYSETHRELPIQTLPVLLLAAIKHGQFVLAVEKSRPVFFLSWAQLSEAAESRYLKNPPESMPLDDWNSGERIWFLDWVAPFGHTRKMSTLITRQLFADKCTRSLYHRGYEKGLRVQTFRGRDLSARQARAWFEAHPLTTTQVNT